MLSVKQSPIIWPMQATYFSLILFISPSLRLALEDCFSFLQHILLTLASEKCFRLPKIIFPSFCHFILFAFTLPTFDSYSFQICDPNTDTLGSGIVDIVVW